MSIDYRDFDCVHRSKFARAVAAALFAACLFKAPAAAERPERGAHDEAREERVCTLAEWNRVDIVSRAYCLANDGELSCTANAQWRCCQAGGQCMDSGALASARPRSLRNDDPAGTRNRPSDRERSHATPRARSAARRRRDH